MLLQTVRGAEQKLRQQTDAGMSGAAAIYRAANGLVSSEMLMHLPLSKSLVLGNLQVNSPSLHRHLGPLAGRSASRLGSNKGPSDMCYGAPQPGTTFSALGK